MGKKAQEIIKLDLDELIADLNRAYSDEWLAYYLYSFMANAVSGNLASEYRDVFEGIAKAEYEHATELFNHIIKLGGVPVKALGDINDNANAEELITPEDFSDIEEFLDISIKSEAEAIEVYQELAEKTMGKDMVTHQLVVHILSEETDHEETFTNLKNAKR